MKASTGVWVCDVEELKAAALRHGPWIQRSTMLPQRRAWSCLHFVLLRFSTLLPETDCEKEEKKKRDYCGYL